MTIEIHQPRLEALIEQRMASGNFQSVEDLLLQMLEKDGLEGDDTMHLSTSDGHAGEDRSKTFGKSLVDAFAEAREILAGVELNVTRDRSPGRPVDFT